MRKPRKFITSGGGTRHYHVVSRIVNRDFVLGTEEKVFFCKIMRKLEAFSGVRILTHCIMSNHFHLLLEVPEPIALSDEEVSQRMGFLYSRMAVDEFKGKLVKAREYMDPAFAEFLKNKITSRMHNLSMFMKDLKQRFTQWYNRRHGRRGTLWEERYRAVLIEGSKHALLTIASYIDLNPVRAGIVEDPKDYKFCGLSEASAGNLSARNGLAKLLRGYDGVLDGLQAIVQYHKHLIEVEGTNVNSDHKAINHSDQIRQRALQAIDEKKELPKQDLLRCRIRYFTDGAILGSRPFVNQFFEHNRTYFGKKRKSGARKIPGKCLDGLCTVRSLQINTFS